jgi:polyhydroxyalkanoate synthase subunit PhaE
MDSKEQSNDDPQTLLTDWLKTASKFWAKPEPEHVQEHEQEQREEPAARKKEPPRSVHESLLSVMKTLGVLSSAMGDPLVMNAAFKGASILPDIVSSLMKSGMQAFSTFQRQLQEKAGKLGASTEYTFDSIDHDTLQVWSTLYEQEIQRYFHIPQIGLNRFYQERFNKAIDKYNVFLTSLTEFLQILQSPFEKTTMAMHVKIEELTTVGALPEDQREYYRMWVKMLEGHFMTLFKSTDYIESLGSTIAAYNDYLGARNGIIQDMLQSFPIPTNKEMNDLYKEVYLLKKKVRELEKENEKE